MDEHTKKVDKTTPSKTDLYEVDERFEISGDPKIKIFGRAPGRLIPVRFEYNPEPTELLEDLTEFIFKHAKLMDYSD